MDGLGHRLKISEGAGLVIMVVDLLSAWSRCGEHSHGLSRLPGRPPVNDVCEPCSDLFIVGWRLRWQEDYSPNALDPADSPLSRGNGKERAISGSRLDRSTQSIDVYPVAMTKCLPGDYIRVGIARKVEKGKCTQMEQIRWDTDVRVVEIDRLVGFDNYL